MIRFLVRSRSLGTWGLPDTSRPPGSLLGDLLVHRGGEWSLLYCMVGRNHTIGQYSWRQETLIWMTLSLPPKSHLILMVSLSCPQGPAIRAEFYLQILHTSRKFLQLTKIKTISNSKIWLDVCDIYWRMTVNLSTTYLSHLRRNKHKVGVIIISENSKNWIIVDAFWLKPIRWTFFMLN